MLILCVFGLTVYAITRLINVMKIGSPIRWLVEKTKIKPLIYLIKCPFCLGFWVGASFHFIINVTDYWWVDGFIGAATSYLLSSLEPEEK